MSIPGDAVSYPWHILDLYCRCLLDHSIRGTEFLLSDHQVRANSVESLGNDCFSSHAESTNTRIEFRCGNDPMVFLHIWTGPALEEQQLNRCLLDVFILYCYHLRSFLEGLFLLVSSSSANV